MAKKCKSSKARAKMNKVPKTKLPRKVRKRQREIKRDQKRR